MPKLENSSSDSDFNSSSESDLAFKSESSSDEDMPRYQKPIKKSIVPFPLPPSCVFSFYNIYFTGIPASRKNKIPMHPLDFTSKNGIFNTKFEHQ